MRTLINLGRASIETKTQQRICSVAPLSTDSDGSFADASCRTALHNNTAKCYVTTGTGESSPSCID
jgi:hypothetical protein